MSPGANTEMGRESAFRRRTAAAWAACAALTAALLATAAGAVAKPAAVSLDPTFGEHGRVVRNADLAGPRWDSLGTGIAPLADGGSVVLAKHALYAFDRHGSIDRSFGGGTVAITAPAGYTVEPAGVAVDSQGRILVAGTAYREGSAFPNVSELALVSRYTAAGEPDPSFGTGGTVLTDFGLPPRRVPEHEPTPPPQVQVAGIAVDSQDRIVLTGTRITQVGPCRGSANLEYRDAFVARLDASGNLDRSFGEGGVDRLYGIASIFAPVVAPGDEIYVWTPYFHGGPCTEFEAAAEARLIGRLDSSGKPDPTFGSGGWVEFAPPERYEELSGLQRLTPVSLALDGRGRLLLLDRHRLLRAGVPASVKVKRLLPSGAVDRRYGRRGAATLQAQRGELQPGAAVVDAKGRELVTGTLTVHRRGSSPAQSFFLGRLTSRGFPDRGFGDRGWLRTGFGRRNRAEASSLLVTGRGAVAAGALRSATGRRLALAGYRIRR